MMGLLFQQDLEERLQAFYADSVNDRRLGNCIFASGSLCTFSLLMKWKGAPGKDKPTFFFATMTTVTMYFYIKMILSVLFTPVCDDSEDNKKDRKLEKIFTSSSLLLSFFFINWNYYVITLKVLPL